MNKIYLKIPDVCPICGEPTVKVTEIDSTVLTCTNDACSGKLINRLDHFCGKKGLDVKGLSKATLEKLIEWKWVKSFTDIFELYHFEEKWYNQSGFGEKSVKKILSAIDTSRQCELYQYISALGIPLIGETASKELAKYFKTWEAFVEAAEGKSFNFYDLPNFGVEMHYAIKNFDYTEAKYIYYNYLKIAEVKTEEKKDILNGKTFCITGSVKRWANRDEAKAFIEALGGKVTSSVSKNTNYLLNNDINSTSSKNMTAKSVD